MGVDIKKLTVSTDDERKQWMELLTKCSYYHYDMAKQFSPEILGDTEMEKVNSTSAADNTTQMETDDAEIDEEQTKFTQAPIKRNVKMKRKSKKRKLLISSKFPPLPVKYTAT